MGLCASTLKWLLLASAVETRTNESVDPAGAGRQSRRESRIRPPAPLPRQPSQPLRPLLSSPRSIALSVLRRPQTIPALGLFLGVIIGLALQPIGAAVAAAHLPIAVIASARRGLRRRPGGARRDLQRQGSSSSPSLSNVLVAALIVFLGDKLGSSFNSRPVSSWSPASGSSRTSPPSADTSSTPDVRDDLHTPNSRGCDGLMRNPRPARRGGALLRAAVRPTKGTLLAGSPQSLVSRSRCRSGDVQRRSEGRREATRPTADTVNQVNSAQ